MSKVPIIEKDGRPEWAVIPYDDYRRLCDAAELLEDTKAYRAAKSEGGEMIPHEVVKRLVAGESPVRVYREYRGLRQRALAAKAKSPQVTFRKSKRDSGPDRRSCYAASPTRST